MPACLNLIMLLREWFESFQSSLKVSCLLFHIAMNKQPLHVKKKSKVALLKYQQKGIVAKHVHGHGDKNKSMAGTDGLFPQSIRSLEKYVEQ